MKVHVTDAELNAPHKCARCKQIKPRGRFSHRYYFSKELQKRRCYPDAYCKECRKLDRKPKKPSVKKKRGCRKVVII